LPTKLTSLLLSVGNLIRELLHPGLVQVEILLQGRSNLRTRYHHLYLQPS
jgi:hypothetical protein